MERNLPRPVERADLYLAAILEELQGLREDVKTAAQPKTQAKPKAVTVELKESPKPRPRKKA